MYIADLHIHSRYSRATSRDCTPEHLDLWARRKGIHIVGSGDFTHPAWRMELAEKLKPAEDGLYVLKEEYRIHDGSAADMMIPRFVITGEISSIYKKDGRVRKVHSLILLPGLEAAEVVSEKLAAIGNIHSDGRPILGLDCRDLLEILLELCPEAVYVPAHIWTPHFSMFGAFSGFDSVEACFGDLSQYVRAVETGLSSDPPMNWRVSALDGFQLISNSDAHSPSKLGREANLLSITLSYHGLREAIQEGKGLAGTIEFFPEEGKYHMDGHRKCGLCLSPAETLRYGGICPVCGRKITIGVSHRVEELADRQEGYRKKDAKPFESLVPLPDVIAASVGHSAASAKVQKEYQKMLLKLGAEFEILRNVPEEDIRKISGNLIAEGISRLRKGRVERVPGFDGEYGTIRLFRPGELENPEGQMDFFGMLGMGPGTLAGKPAEKSKEQEKKYLDAGSSKTEKEKEPYGGEIENTALCHITAGLNAAQKQAVTASERRTAVIAGPGTGKTKTLVSHIVYLLENKRIKPAQITAVTFTNQAAKEMRERIQKELGRRRRLAGLQIGTFHAVCLTFLKEQGVGFTLADETLLKETAKTVLLSHGISAGAEAFLQEVSLWKTGLLKEADCGKEDVFQTYDKDLKEKGLFDFDDLLLETIRLLKEKRTKKDWQKRFSFLLVDEFQDISPVQYYLMKLWNETGRELFVIGDPDQSIYGFRGADAGCFDRMKEEYSDMNIVKLEENYRCTPQILKASLEVVSGNPGERRILRPNCGGRIPVRLVKTPGEMSGAIFVAKELNRLAGGIGMLEAHDAMERQQDRKIRGFDEVAVLYRTHRQARLLETCLKKEGIPYIVAGREDFLKTNEVRGSVCFFRYLGNREDILSKEQSIKLLWNTKSNPLSEQIAEETADRFQKAYEEKKPRKFLEAWIKEMQLEKSEPMKKLAGMTVFYQTMPEFLEALTFGVESDLKRCGGTRFTSGAVTLMTLHGSKGLEFPAVIIYGVEKGTVPLESEKYETDIEEERRLLYVGMTRAKEELILTCSEEESEFTEHLSDEWIVREEEGKKKREEYHQMSLFE